MSSNMIMYVLIIVLCIYDTLSDLLYIGVAEAKYLHEVVHIIHNIHL